MPRKTEPPEATKIAEIRILAVLKQADEGRFLTIQDELRETLDALKGGETELWDEIEAPED